MHKPGDKRTKVNAHSFLVLSVMGDWNQSLVKCHSIEGGPCYVGRHAEVVLEKPSLLETKGERQGHATANDYTRMRSFSDASVFV